jgi:hypothetical protein
MSISVYNSVYMIASGTRSGWGVRVGGGGASAAFDWLAGGWGGGGGARGHARARALEHKTALRTSAEPFGILVLWFYGFMVLWCTWISGLFGFS